MKKIGIVSYNIYCNFTNYGSALQSWALYTSIKKMGYPVKLVDYCPDILKDKDPLNPYKNIWDKTEEAKQMCELSMPSILINYKKFTAFYYKRFNVTSKYDSSNFNSIINEVDSFVCGSDTIFSPDEFGLDDGYLANYECMKNNSISYAASFGDPHFSPEELLDLDRKLMNFKSLGIREKLMIDYIKSKVDVPVKKVIDPTLLLESKDYSTITFKKRLIKEDYLLYYSRRFNPILEEYVESIAKRKKLKIVEISLRATNSKKGHIMYYQAGVEEFLSLVKYANFVVTNSFHGAIFSVHFRKDFVVFSRALCDTKIIELLDMLGLSDRLLITGDERIKPINYKSVFERISAARAESLEFLKESLNLL